MRGRTVLFGFRGKLFWISLLFIALVDIAIGFYLDHELRTTLEQRVEDELTRHADTVRDAVELLLADATIEQGEPVADRLGVSTRSRVTIIGQDGRVLGDSELSLAEIPQAENHGDRPEVLAARTEGLGIARRHSGTFDQDMVYVAVPVRLGDENGVVRTAVPLESVREAIGRMRVVLGIGAVSAIVLAALVLGLVQAFVSRTVRAVVDAAQAMASGKTPGTPLAQDTEIDGLAGSLNRLARELERTMQMLSTERDRFETVLETMDQAVLALDRSRRVTTVNRAARRLLALPPDVEGKTLLEAVRLAAVDDMIERAEVGQPAEAELEVGDGKWLQARATVQADGGTVVVVQDVTEIRRLERVRQDFVANVSHELRTPISVIRANTETLLAGGLEDPVRSRQFVEAVLRHAERLGRLVADLLDISRIEAGRYHLSPEATSVLDVADRVLDSLEVEIDKKRMTVTLDIEEHVCVFADPKALEHVLINLVGNAVKYTQAGGHVAIGTVPEGDRIRVEVSDDGPGIDPAHRRRLFERFYRVDPGRSRDMGGTGLGLSIVKHLVDAMGGRVGVDARSPKGSVFWFSLARAPSAVEPRAGEVALVTPRAPQRDRRPAGGWGME